MSIELKVPTAGESITEVQIGEWRKAEGDYVEDGEIVVEIETDKASMELPAPAAGRIEKLLKPQGETVPIGEIIAMIDETATAPTDGNGKAASSTPAEPKAKEDAKQKREGEAPAEPQARDTPKSTRSPAGEPRVMPAAQRIIAQQGLSTADITPTGPGGRILKEDAQHAAASGPRAGHEINVASGPRAGREPAAASTTVAPSSATELPTAAGPREEQAVPMSMLRKRIAQRLVEAQNNAAILTTFNEVDMTAILALREQRQDDFVKRYGVKLGFMSFFVKAAIDALRQFSAVNAELRGTDIVYKNYYDIGVAVSTDRGLVVPVIRNAELLSFAQIEATITDLATRARDKKLEVEELTGGTFTISNGGVFGSLLSTPILNPPQVGILGLHAIQERPVAIDGKVEIRPMMYVALSYDHRLIDGRESVSFLKRIKQCAEDPTRMLIEA